MDSRPTDAYGLLELEHAVARALCGTANRAEVYPAVLSAIGKTLGWDLGAAWEVTRAGGDSMHCVATWSAPSADAERFEALTRLTRLRLGEGLPGRVWADGQPAWIVDVASDGNFPRSTGASRAGLHAAVCFPTLSPTGVLGAIEFFASELRPPDPALLETMASLGGQIGQFADRTRAEADVRASEVRKRAMLEAALDCVITMDHEGMIVDFNHAAERTFGYTADEVVGREMAALIVPPASRELHRAGLARIVAGGDARLLDRRIEITGMRSDGSEFPVELTITRIALPGPPTFTGYIRDITDRKRADEELRASRARIVDAADAERRRLERDLHDGAQQRLVALGLSLRMGRDRVHSDPAAAVELLDEAIDDLKLATAELRELARGIHPAVLTEGGLEPALSALAARGTVPVTVTAVTGRLPTQIEAAAYFVVAEALTNVARYAFAGKADVMVARDNGRLVIEVSDDGKGGADARAGSGLEGLADRVAALGGRFEVSSPVGAGTVVSAEIPCG